MADTAVDIAVDLGPDHVAVVELRRPPNNHLDGLLVKALAEALRELDRTPSCRSIVLCSAGKHFSAGANFGKQANGIPVHTHVSELFEGSVPIVAAVQGAAIGAGLGLACVADFRVGCAAARFAANFARIGLHHGFGLSVTLPAIVGQQAALDLLYTGRRVRGDEAFRLGLCDRFTTDTDVRSAAHALAVEIASSAPLAVRSVRATMRGSLAAAVRSAMADEIAQQTVQRRTADFAEGVLAYRERRLPVFNGR